VSEPPPTPPPSGSSGSSGSSGPPPPGAGTPAAGTPAPTPPPRPTTKRGKPKKPKVQRKGFGTYAFTAIIVIAVLVAVWQIVMSFTKSDDPKIGDHIHAALGINVCGFPAENAPSFDFKAGEGTSQNSKAGLHSHGDGLIHIHPFISDEEGDNATVGLFMEYGGFEVDEEHMALWDDLNVTNGDPCPDGRTGSVRWAVNGEEQDGNPADYKPEDQDVIEIAFLPDGEPIPEPPAEVLAALPNPTDVKQDG
jgi:hypothetical protein